MAHFRFRYKTLGGHTHVRVFAGPSENATHGKCGDLTMTVAEFNDFWEKAVHPDIVFTPDDKD